MSFVRPKDWRPQGVGELEPRAWEALRQTERTVLVTAGAGAGKDGVFGAEGNLATERPRR